MWLLVLGITCIFITQTTNAESTTFQNVTGSQTCTTEICTFECTVGCPSLIVDVSNITKELNFVCSASKSCYDMRVNADTIATLNMQCSGSESCGYSDIYVDTAENIDISCNYDAISSSDSPCGNMKVYARHSGHSNLYCPTSYNCYPTYLYVDYANSTSISCNGLKSCYQIYVDGNGINGNGINEVNIECTNSEACKSGRFYMNYVAEVNITCDWGLASSDANGACRSASFYAQNSGHSNILCNKYDCYLAHFELNNANSSKFVMDGYYATKDAEILADNIVDSLDIICINDRSCYGIDIYTQYATADVSISCNGTYVCAYLLLEAGTMSGNLNIECESDDPSIQRYPCQHMNLKTYTMTGSFNVECKNGYSCDFAYLRCPTNSDCNINCSDDYGCYEADIRRDGKNEHFDPINLSCGNSSSSCELATVECGGGGPTRTELIWNSDDNVWECDDYGCCPFGPRGNISCAANQPCNLTSTTAVEYKGYFIDATEATSLTMHCNSASCEGSKMLCPQKNNSSCIFNCGSARHCNYVVIEANDNTQTMDTFELNCVTDSCWYSDITLNVSSISNVDLLCRGNGSCYEFQAVSNAVINTVNIECLGLSACTYGIFTFSNPATAVSLTCTGHWSCLRVDIDHVIGTTYVADCVDDEACRESNFNLDITASDSNVVFNCVNPSGLLHSCYAAQITVDGFSDGSTNVSLKCDGQRDCKFVDLHGNNINSANAMCLGEASCEYTEFFMDTASNFNLLCNNTAACAFTTKVNCPYGDVGVCNIDCKGGTLNTCKFLDINVLGNYVYDYLNLNCEANDVNGSDSLSTCESLHVDCNGAINVNYIYNPNTQDYECEYNGLQGYCCHYEGTSEPTTATPTTASPTLFPTTSIPTTTVPTSAVPTLFPTTSIPTTALPTTSVPTTSVPTMAPTTLQPSTGVPTTSDPTSAYPTIATAIPTTSNPTSAIPSTSDPTTSVPTSGSTIINSDTNEPTTNAPTTAGPSTGVPTTNTTSEQTTAMPTSSNPTSSNPTTTIPTTAECDDLDSSDLTCYDDDCDPGDPYLSISLSFDVCTVPFVGQRRTFWALVSDCLCEVTLDDESGLDIDYSDFLERRRLTGNSDKCDYRIIRSKQQNRNTALDGCDRNGYSLDFTVDGCGDCEYLQRILSGFEPFVDAILNVGACVQAIGQGGFIVVENVEFDAVIEGDCDVTNSGMLYKITTIIASIISVIGLY